ncbi:MAG: segregation/condensation protein A [Patescibacteria group bacterium]
MNVRLEQFEGPLDLLVQLIHENKLNISEISLANITEQYLAYLVEVEERFPEELADFLVIATRLLLIKSKLFLPVSDEEEDDEERLSSQLKIYKTFVDASQAVQSLISRRRFLYARPMTRWSDMPREFHPPANFGVGALQDMFLTVLGRLQPVISLPRVQIERAISLRERIADLVVLLQRCEQIRFYDVLQETRNRTEIVVTFLALLELVKQQNIVVKQTGLFHDIVIQSISHE